MARNTVGAKNYDLISEKITQLEDSSNPVKTALKILKDENLIGKDNVATVKMAEETYDYLSGAYDALSSGTLTKEKVMKTIEDEIAVQATEAMNKAFGNNSEAISTSLGRLFSAKDKTGVINWMNSDLLTKEGAGVILGKDVKPLVKTIKEIDNTYKYFSKKSLAEVKNDAYDFAKTELTKNMKPEEIKSIDKLINAPNFSTFKNEALKQIEAAVLADKGIKAAYDEGTRIYNMKDPNASKNAILALAIQQVAGENAEQYAKMAEEIRTAKTKGDAIGIIGNSILKEYTGADAQMMQDKLEQINKWRKDTKAKSTTQAVGEALEFAAENMLSKEDIEFVQSAAKVTEIISIMIDDLKAAKARGASLAEKVTIVSEAIVAIISDNDEIKAYLNPFIETLEGALATEAAVGTIWDAAKSDPTALANVGILEGMGSLVAAAATMNVANLGFQPLNTTIPGVETIWPMKNELWDSSEQLAFVKSPVLRAMLDLHDIKSKTENCSIVMTKDGNLLIKERHTNKILFQTDTAGSTMSEAEEKKEYTRIVADKDGNNVKDKKGDFVKEKFKLVTEKFDDVLTTMFRKKVNIGGKLEEHLILQPKPYSFAIIEMDNQVIKYDANTDVAQWLAIEGVGMGFRMDAKKDKNVNGDFVISFETAGSQGLKVSINDIGSSIQTVDDDNYIIDNKHGRKRKSNTTEHFAKYNFFRKINELGSFSRSKKGSETSLHNGDGLQMKSGDGGIALAARLEKDGVINIIKYKHIFDHSLTTYGEKTIMNSKYLEKIFYYAPGFKYVPPYKLVMNKYYVAILDANGNFAMIYPFVAGRKTDEQKKKIAEETGKLEEKLQDEKDKNNDDNNLTKSTTGKKSGKSGENKGFDIDEMISKHSSRTGSSNIGDNTESSKKFDWDAAIKRINEDELSEYHYYDFKGLEKLNEREVYIVIGVNNRSPLYVEQYHYGQDKADQYAEFYANVGPIIINNLRHKILMKTTLPYNIHDRFLDKGRPAKDRHRDQYDIESGAVKSGVKDGIYWTGRSMVGSNNIGQGGHQYRKDQRVWKSRGNGNDEDSKSCGEFIVEGISGKVPVIKYWTSDIDLPISYDKLQGMFPKYNDLLSFFPGHIYQVQFSIEGFDAAARYIGQSPVYSDIISLRKRLNNGHYFVVNIAKPIIKGAENGEVTGDLPWDIYKNTYCRIFFTIEDESGVPVENNFDKKKLNDANNSMTDAKNAKGSHEKEVISNKEKK